MPEINSISYFPSHQLKWTVRGNFRGVGELCVNVNMPKQFVDAIIKFAQAELDKKEAEMHCAIIGDKEMNDGK